MDAPLEACPIVSLSLEIKVFHSASATYHAPSDLSGIGGMYCEWIRATPSWQNGAGRYDCVFIDNKPEVDSFVSLYVARVKLFLSFAIEGTDSEAAGNYPCALVEWFSTYGDLPCEDTGLWSVVPERDARHQRVTSIVHIDTILRAAHLIGIAGHQRLPKTLDYNHSLDVFQHFYINKYIDYCRELQPVRPICGMDSRQRARQWLSACYLSAHTAAERGTPAECPPEGIDLTFDCR
jgi:hypothetical protein